MYDAIWNALPGCLSSERMKEDINELFQDSRWSSFDRILALARKIVSRMETIGMEDVRLIDFPADGETAHGGWVLPKAYDVHEARLSCVIDGGNEILLADYAQAPTSLMMYSQPTPAEGVTGDLIIADAIEDITEENCRGKMVLTARLGIPWTQAAVRSEAIGVVSDFRGVRRFIKDGPYLDETNEWHNYSIPPWNAPDKGFGFAITPNQGRELREGILEGKKVQAHAVVRAEHYVGNLPVISGLLPGESKEEIALTGHYDEFGADDNCSQVAVALEAIRAIKAMVSSGQLPRLRRSLRLLFPMEVRGFNALIQNDEETRHLRAGLNIDTVGTDQNATTSICTLTENFISLPSFVDDFAAELLERVRTTNPLFRWNLTAADTIDNIFGEPLVGAPTPSIYHYSGTHHLAMDTPGRISGQMLLDMAQVSATYAAFLANAGLDEAVWLADLTAERGIQRLRSVAAKALRGEKGQSRQETWKSQLNGLYDRYREKTASVAWLVPGEQFFASTSQVESNTGKLLGESRLLPRELLDERVSCFQDRLRDATEAVRDAVSQQDYFSAGDTRPPLPESTTVPVKTFKGFLSFETASGEEKRFIEEELGIGIGWGISMSVVQAIMLANGKRTVSEIAETVRRNGVGSPDVSRLEKTFEFLATKNMVRLRPFITVAQIRSALEEAGIEAGDTVLGHFSLSQFGYIEGGADRVIDTIEELLGPQGTLMMPTFTFSCLGARPYDRKRSPSRVGSVTNRFWQRPGVLRNRHPTHSFASSGRLAGYLFGHDDPEESPLSKDGPIGRLHHSEGKILMFCGIGPNTCMHAGDYWQGIPLPEFVCHLIEGGTRKEISVKGSPWHARFDKAYEKMYERGQVTDVHLGESVIHTMNCRDAVSAQAEVARDDPSHLISPGCECPYCHGLKAHCDELAGRS